MTKFNHLLLLIRCLARSVVHGRASTLMDAPKKFLVVQLAQLGDMVCVTPMFRALKIHYPNSTVYVMGSPRHAELLAYNADVDEYISYEKNSGSLIQKLRDEHIDTAFLVVPDFSALALLYLAGIPLIVAPELQNGRSPNESRLYNILKRLVVRVPYFFGHYFPRQYLKLLEPVEIRTEDTTKHLGFSDTARARVVQFLRDADVHEGDTLIGVSPSAGNKIKLWPAERFAEVIRHCTNTRGAKVILIAGKSDREESAAVLRLVGEQKNIIDATEVFNLDGLKALIARLQLFISVDTGPIYIAEAFGVPTIDIVGPMDEHEQPPRGPLHVSVIPPGHRVPQLHITNAHPHDATEARRQVLATTVQQVLESLPHVLSNLS